MPSQKCQTLGDELIFPLAKRLGTWQTSTNGKFQLHITVGDALNLGLRILAPVCKLNCDFTIGIHSRDKNTIIQSRDTVPERYVN